MDCNDVHYLIHGFIDGELDLVSSLNVERHISDCEGCRGTLEQMNSLRKVLRESSLKFPAPARLEQRIRQQLGLRSAAASAHWTTSWKPWAWAASVALAVFVFWRVATLPPPVQPEASLAQEILDSHIRSLMANHLTDVLSTDQHTVKPWFNGKVDFSPTVVDLADRGISLVGGRLDYIDGKPIAVLVYQRRLHIINLFSFPFSGNAESAMSTQTLHGYHLLSWKSHQANYWAVSDLDETELRQFAQAFQQ